MRILKVDYVQYIFSTFPIKLTITIHPFITIVFVRAMFQFVPYTIDRNFPCIFHIIPTRQKHHLIWRLSLSFLARLSTWDVVFFFACRSSGFIWYWLPFFCVFNIDVLDTKTNNTFAEVNKSSCYSKKTGNKTKFDHLLLP